ncbi:MAG: ABC transporter permease [Lysobacter sp.]|nr:ABC transporter permease [Lysobacter sp.]
MSNVLRQPFAALIQHRSLVMQLARREVLGRYRGATFGMLWSLISPILMLMIYTLAFGYILKSRWPGSSGSTEDFVLILFCGLILHSFFAECLTTAPRLIIANSNYVKKVVFPLDALVWSMVFSALFHLVMNIVVLLVLKLVLHGSVPWTVLFLPLVILPLLVLAAGVSLLVSAIGVYVRDVGQFVGVLATAMLFLSSAIVPVESIPEEYKWVFMSNPLTPVINQAREVVIWGRVPDWGSLGLQMLLYLAFLVFGSLTFNKMRRGFADVL